ncbi:AAA family ATPase [Caenimonas koreensis]|uniref:AAA family ATPase n=1 Tax=Caenimonas koreensis DSM 17982 TaxID=1121255 RepID=A0A844BBI8_9BURK|nr:ATP-binding protein [Caenimonas koreensis]MRD48959.1 AAA family ATPase [Caenimonas koreensis DSM 17982]
MKIALLGAESTGKTQLTQELAAHLRAQGKSVVVVPEVLRSWCEQAGRTPRPEEQMPIAQEQERLVDISATQAQVVITDTTAIMVAIYSAMLFGDGSLYQFALARQRTYDITLVTGLDLPWVADGLQRDGPHVREPVDALLRAALAKAGVVYRVIYGNGAQRTANALSAIDSMSATLPAGARQRRWTWLCDKCSDPECEHRLFRAKLSSR